MRVSKQEKLLQRLRSKPTDFTWSELMTLMKSFGFVLHARGGSSRKFLHAETKATLMMHEPHPGSILKVYQVRAVIDFLKGEGYTR